MALTRLHSTRDFFRIWFYWKTQALVIFLTIVGLIMFFSYAYTPDYDSTAKILILPRTGEGMLISAGKDETRVAPVSSQDINTEIELLISDEVIKETIRSFEKVGLGLKLEEKSLSKYITDFIKKVINEILIFIRLKERLSPFDQNVVLLRDSLEIEPIAMSNIIFVTLTAESPKAAKVVLDRLMEIYIEHHKDVFTKEEGVQFFDEQANVYRKKLELAEKKYKKFQNEFCIIDLPRQNQTNIELLSELQKTLSNIEITVDEYKSRTDILHKLLAKNDNDIIITKEMRTIPAIVKLEEATVPLLIKRSEIMKTYIPSSRAYKDINGQIETIRNDIRNEILKAIRTDEMELETLLAKQRSLQNKIDRLHDEAVALNQKERELKELEREVELHRNNYMLYSSKAEDARIYSDRKKRDLSNVSIADQASTPVKAAFPNRIIMLVISLVVGLFAAIGTPFFLEFLDHSIKTSHEIEDLISLPVICSLPEVKS